MVCSLFRKRDGTYRGTKICMGFEVKVPHGACVLILDWIPFGDHPIFFWLFCFCFCFGLLLVLGRLSCLLGLLVCFCGLFCVFGFLAGIAYWTAYRSITSTFVAIDN